MLKRVLLLMFLAMAGMVPLSAQIDALNGICFSGGRSAVVNGLNSSNKLDGIIPSCTVTVYLTGTTTLATIYRDSLSTPLANPFTADNLAAAAPGKWLFFATTGVGYDVTMSGGIPPLTYLLPVTLTDLKVGGGGGGSGVTNFSAGNLLPLFTTSVTNPTTTPALGFTLSTAAAQTIFGNFTGSARGPFFGIYSCTGLLTCTFDQPSNTLTLNVPNSSSLSITTTTPIKVNGGNGPVASGTANISCDTCSSNTLAPLVTAPVAGQYVILYPHVGAVTHASYPNVPLYAFADGTSANGVVSLGRICSLSFTNTIEWSGYTLADYGISPGQVTAVYAFGVSNLSATNQGGACFFDAAPPVFAASSFVNGGVSLLGTGQPYTTQQVTSITSLTGAAIASATATASMTESGQSGLLTELAVNSVGLIVYYTGTAVTNPTYLNIGPNLRYDKDTNTLDTDPTFPRQLWGYALADIPDPGKSFNEMIVVSGTTDCATASADPFASVLCKVQLVGLVYSWVPANGGGGGGGGTYFTETLTCTSTCALAHTPVVFDNISVNGLIMINGTDFTQSGTTVTLTTPAVGGDVYYAQYHY